jgi:hypothetical protein
MALLKLRHISEDCCCCCGDRLVDNLISAFEARVLADGGTFEAKSCLKDLLLPLLKGPVNTVPPEIQGTMLFGDTITVTNGTWESSTGILQYSYRWFRNDVLIAGETSNTYTLQFIDIDAEIRAEVSAIDSEGSGTFTTSNTIIGQDTAFIMRVDTSISGTGTVSATDEMQLTGAVGDYIVEAYQGNTLIANLGTFTGAQTLTLPSAGIYDLRIIPTGATPFNRIEFSNSGDRNKVLGIRYWGQAVQWSSFENAFWGCNNNAFFTKWSNT